MKYAALFLNSCAILLLGWALYGAFQLPKTSVRSAHPMTVELLPLPVALRSDQVHVVDAFDAMSRIQTQAARPGTDPLTLIALPIPGSDVVGSLQMPRRSMSLYLDNYVAETQTVVIDDQLAQQGTRLQNGGKVARVGPNGVIVTESLGRQKLALPEADLRIGTLRWPDGSLASVNTQQFRAGPPGALAESARSLP